MNKSPAKDNAKSPADREGHSRDPLRCARRPLALSEALTPSRSGRPGPGRVRREAPSGWWEAGRYLVKRACNQSNRCGMSPHRASCPPQFDRQLRAVFPRISPGGHRDRPLESRPTALRPAAHTWTWRLAKTSRRPGPLWTVFRRMAGPPRARGLAQLLPLRSITPARVPRRRSHPEASGEGDRCARGVAAVGVSAPAPSAPRREERAKSASNFVDFD